MNSSKDLVLLFHLSNLEACKLKVFVFISMFIVGIKELRFCIFYLVYSGLDFKWLIRWMKTMESQPHSHHSSPKHMKW